jgi:hypothetical protein
VRTDSERELSAASQRRDSINAQLANVRQMLATLTGTAAMPLTAFGADDEEAGATDEAHGADAGDEAETPHVADESDGADGESEGDAEEGSGDESEESRDESLAESRG